MRLHRPWLGGMLWLLAAGGVPAVAFGAAYVVYCLEGEYMQGTSIETAVSLWILLAPGIWCACIATLMLVIRRMREMGAQAAVTPRWRIAPVWAWALSCWLAGIWLYRLLHVLESSIPNSVWDTSLSWWPTLLNSITFTLVICTLSAVPITLVLMRRRAAALGPLIACIPIFPLVWFGSQFYSPPEWSVPVGFYSSLFAWGALMYAPLFWWAFRTPLPPALACSVCGYDLAGLGTMLPCPECGAPPLRDGNGSRS
jgi:hypothetical protein